MKHKFTLGIVAGMSSLALAIPVLAQISSAASTNASSTASTQTMPTRPAPTIQNVQDMITNETKFLQNVDAAVALEKSTTQTHITALTAAATITDDTQREAAVKAANEAQKASIDAAISANADVKYGMRPMGMGDMRGGHGMMGRGPNPAALATKLGMTEADLKAAIESGKTIEQIAQEKGVTLPARPQGEHGPRGNWNGPENDQTETSEPAAQ